MSGNKNEKVHKSEKLKNGRKFEKMDTHKTWREVLQETKDGFS
jgi:hypothetical protein